MSGVEVPSLTPLKQQVTGPGRHPGRGLCRFDEFAVVPLRIHDAGDQIIVECKVTGATKAGRKLDAPAAWVWTVRQGKGVRNVNYHDTNAWRQALGT